MAGRRDVLEVDSAILVGATLHSPVDAVARVLDAALPVGATTTVGWPVGGDDVPVRRDLGQEVAVGGPYCRAAAVAERDEGHADAVSGRLDRRVDSVVWQVLRCRHLRWVRAGTLGDGALAPVSVSVGL